MGMGEEKVFSLTITGEKSAGLASVSEFNSSQGRQTVVRDEQLRQAKIALVLAYEGRASWGVDHGYKIGNTNVELDANSLEVIRGDIHTKYTFDGDGKCTKVEQRDESSNRSLEEIIEPKKLAHLKKEGENLLRRLPQEGRVVNNSSLGGRHIRL